MNAREPVADQAWRPLRTADGTWTFTSPVHGQACHSLVGAWTEAIERYVVPCELARIAAERARVGGALRLLDVGTGPAWNLAAALRAVASSGEGARVDIVTLELDRRVIEAAAARHGGADEVADGPAASSPLAEAERWQLAALDSLSRALRPGAPPAVLLADPRGRPLGELRLLLGDARETLRALPESCGFDAVFLDPFSPAIDPPLWDGAFLAEVVRRMLPGARLSTYTVAAGVRVELARAGLRVGAGPRVGAKAGGTIAVRSVAVGSGGGFEPDLPPRQRRRLERRLSESAGSTAERSGAADVPVRHPAG